MPRKFRRSNNLSKRLSRLEARARPEVKHSATSSDWDYVGSVQGTLIKPMILAQSVGRNGRVGDKVKSRNIRFQALLKMRQNPTEPTCAVRVLVLRSKKTNPDTDITGTGDFPNYYEAVDEDKFFVIKDMLIGVSALQARTVTGTSYETGSSIKKIKFNISTGLRKLQFNGGTAQSPLNNEYVVYMIAENDSANVTYNYKHYYIDN